MKRNIWLVFVAMISASLLAQPASPPAAAPSVVTPAPTNAPPTTPTPSPAAAITNAPPAKAQKKKAKKSAQKSAPGKKAVVAELRTVPLIAGQAVVVASNVNVRGQAKLNSEVITRIHKGQTVNVLEEIVLNSSGPSEPSAWAKIILPANVHVWAHSSFINSSNKTVIPKRLKLRAGPGENYSVLGIIKQGDEVKEVGSNGEWLEIEAPAEACGFVAAQYLKQEAVPAETPTAPTEPPATPAVVAENPPVAPAPTETPATTTPPPTEPAVAQTPPEPPAPVVEEPPPPRIVEREGFVRGTFSIQSPTKFELVSPDTGRIVNYLHATSPSLDLKRYKGLRIIVTGEEGLDERWKNTPVITIQKIQVLD
jgi:uncharacterized protein YgiM (DUF1202 family)